MKKLALLCALGICSVGAMAQKAEKKNKETKQVMTAAKELNKEYTTASGLKYKIIQKGNGAKAEAGANVSVHYVGTLTNGTKFDSSRDRGQPFSFKLGRGQVIKGWDEGIALLQVGDKAILTIPAELGYGERQAGSIPSNSTLVFEVELMDVKEPVKPWNITSKDTVTTPSGLKYIVVSRADANATQAAAGKTVSVHYTGFLLNGNIFDSSVERGEPISFPLGNGMVIKGWEEGIALMKVGDKFRLIIPPNLAYGDQERGSAIPANSTLIFDCELINVQ